MQFENLYRVVSLIAGLAFIIALVLTLWPDRWKVIIAAVLYAGGLLTYIVYFGRQLHTFIPSVPYLFFLIKWALPVWLLGYAIGCCVLLWPSISQEKALRFGKTWQLTVGLPLIAMQLTLGAGWLLYFLLWLRIRESYAGCFEQAKCDCVESPEDRSHSGLVSPRLKWGLYFAAWSAVVVITLVTHPSYLSAAQSFPTGLVALFPNGEQRAVEMSMLGPAAVGFGWIIYAVITFIVSYTRKVISFSIIFILLCVVLLLNIAGCNKMLDAVARIH